MPRDGGLQPDPPKRRGATPIRVGDRVAYSVFFLRSAGMMHGTAPRMRGKVTALDELCPGFVLADIAWDCGHTGRVNTGNLTLEARITADTLNT